MALRRRAFALVATGLGLILAGAATVQHTPAPPAEQVWQAPLQIIPVGDFPAKGPILDIGGGGWGIIGQLKGQKVIAIDIDDRELLEAPPGPFVKIVMDARALQFLDNAFPTATVFFTFMFIAPADHEQVFREIRRVLIPGGRLLIWDAVLPKLADARKKYASFPITFKLPGKEINAGYSTYLVPGGQGLAHFEELAVKTRFAVVSKKTSQDWFFLELSKPL